MLIQYIVFIIAGVILGVTICSRCYIICCVKNNNNNNNNNNNS